MNQSRLMAPVRTAFVMEQSLGHVTHYRNLREFADGESDITPIWLPIPFEARGATGLVPVLRSNWSVRASWRARRALEAVQGPLDAIVFHTQVTSLFSTRMMRRVPSLISLDATPINFDGFAEHYKHRPAGDGFVERRKYLLNRSAFHAAAGLVTWSEWARRSLTDDYGVDGGRVRVLPPGAGAGYFELGRARAARPVETGSARIRLLFVGGDFERKGGPALLEIMRGPLGERCELHVVTQAEVPAQPNVIVHRGLDANGPDLLRQFAQADLFVMPTLADCLGIVLMEAAAAGLPLITTHVGGVGETVQPDESGLLIPVSDARALSTALATLVDNPQMRQRMGRAGYALANQKFDARRNNRALLDLIQELVHARQVSRRAA